MSDLRRPYRNLADAASQVGGSALAVACMAFVALEAGDGGGAGDLGDAIARIDGRVRLWFFLGIAGIVAIALVTMFVACYLGERSPLAAGEMLARGAGRLLPAVVRREYVEEWRSWLRDLRDAGEPWRRRVAELLSILLVAAPRLAVTLRLSQAVDR